MNSLRVGIISLTMILLTGCAVTPQKSLDQLIIQNNASTNIYDVVLRDVETNMMMACSTILSGYDCSVGFDAVENKDHGALLTWKQNGKAYKKMLPTDQNPSIHPDYPNKAVVTILDGGQLTLNLD